MDIHAWVQAFRSLRTTDSRHKALEALVAELTPYEWRTLQSMANARSFHFDLIAHLPTELVAHIFSYLEPTAPHRLQLVCSLPNLPGRSHSVDWLTKQVCRRWSHALQSLDVLKRSLSSWYHGTAGLQGVDYAFCKRKAQSAHAFCTGNPRSRFTIFSLERIQSPVLSGNTLVWKPSEDARVLYALNLSTLSLSTLRGEAREDIRMYFASEQLMAFVSMTNIFYVSELNGQGRRNFKVPNSKYLTSVSFRGRTVACAAPFDHHISIYIWNYDTRQGKAFEIRRPSPLVTTCDQVGHARTNPCGFVLLVQPESESILVLSDNYCPSCHGPNMDPSFRAALGRPRPRIMCSRFSYAGECVQSPRVILTESRFGRNCFDPVGPRGVFGAFVHAKRQDNDTKSVLIRTQFDEHLGEFTDPKCPLSEGLHEFPRYVNGWNGIFYRASFEKTQAGTQILEFAGTSDCPKSKPLATVGNDIHVSDLDYSHTDSFVLLNDQYVVRYGHYFFHVLGFDESNERPKESGRLFDIGTIVVDE